MRAILICLAALTALAGLGCDERLAFGLLQDYGLGGFGDRYNYGYSDYGYGDYGYSGGYADYEEPVYYEVPSYDYGYYEPCGSYDWGCW